MENQKSFERDGEVKRKPPWACDNRTPVFKYGRPKVIGKGQWGQEKAPSGLLQKLH